MTVSSSKPEFGETGAKNPDLPKPGPFTIFTSQLDKLVNWGRKWSVWPHPMGISCCAIELMASAAPRYDLARFGMEAMRFSPRQSDCMIAAGTLSYKMAPILRQIYDQMQEPKWVIAQGACLCTGGMYDSYNVVQGLDEIVPVDIYVPGCPPRPEALLDALMTLQKKITKEHWNTHPRRSYRPKISIPKTTLAPKATKPEYLSLNIGPQHPSTHGVLRVKVELDGETIVSSEPEVGFLHRGKEKIGETKDYHQFIPYTDRFDYTCPPAMNVGYVMAVEKLLDIEAPPRCQWVRTILFELARISSHLISFGCYAMDVGAVSFYLWTFAEREFVLDIFEEFIGHRFTTSSQRIGGLPRDITPEFIEKIRKFVKHFIPKLEEWDNFLARNRIWMDRTRGVGVLKPETAIDYGVTGPNLRASGIPHDLRKARPYLIYDQLDWKICSEQEGDSYARFRVRLDEMKESIKMVGQAVENIPEGPISIDQPNVIIPPKDKVYTEMESLIHHFMIISEGIKVPEGAVFWSQENPKGELGWYIESDGSSRAKRLHIHSSAYRAVQALPEMVNGQLVADLVTTLASLDPVLGEIDK
ncbi:NADH dehydrogenase (quinone) subunit D [Bdellovibrionota bacterium]